MSEERRMAAESPREGDTAAVPAEDLALIERFARRALGAEEVYTFPVVLCDNEVDRDGERFSGAALEGLAKLFVGKTGIFDHDPKGRNQTARIYRCRVEEDATRTTSAGETYRALRADAYLMRSEANRELILEIDGGIKKEVSVGCAMGSAVCSICGADRRKAPCGHRPGERYEGRLCHTVLGEPTDAYEWSFVAVPAQPRAGVVKGLGARSPGEGMLSVLQKALARGEGLTLTPGEAAELARWAGELREAAREGREAREKALQEAVRLGRLACPRLDRELIRRTLAPLTAGEISAWAEEYRQRAAKRLPIPQTALPKEEGAGEGGNEPFRV